MGILQERILEVLHSVPAASTSQISKAIKRPYSNTLNALLNLKDKGLVKDLKRYELFPNGLTGIQVRYWFLTEREKEALKCLSPNSHTSQ